MTQATLSTGNCSKWWPLLVLPDLWQLLQRSALYWKKFEAAQRYFLHHELCWAFAVGVSAEQLLCPLWTMQPMSLGCRDWSETAWLSLTTGRSCPGNLQSLAAGCTPTASAYNQGGPFSFICLRLALSDLPWVKCQWSSSPWGRWLNRAQNTFWFQKRKERKDMFLYHHIFLSILLLSTCMVPCKLHKALTFVVPTALQHSLKELTIFTVQLNSILLPDEWSSSLW